jgi:hypothetical protein
MKAPKSQIAILEEMMFRWGGGGMHTSERKIAAKHVEQK